MNIATIVSKPAHEQDLLPSHLRRWQNHRSGARQRSMSEQIRARLTSFFPAVLLIGLAFALSDQAAAADECATKPDGVAPQGSHWYYRTDRSNGKKCWFLGPESAKAQLPARQAATSPARLPPSKPKLPAVTEKPVENTAIENTNAENINEDQSTEEATAASLPDRLPTPYSVASFALPTAPTTVAAIEEDSAARSESEVSPVGPIVTFAEYPTAEPQPDITFANLFITLLAALGLVYMIIYLAFSRNSILRKLWRSDLQHRLGLTSATRSSGRNASEGVAELHHADTFGEIPEVSAPKLSDAGTDAQASVHRLLQELQQRQRHQLRDLERAPRRVSA
jgi:hypothetical protein